MRAGDLRGSALHSVSPVAFMACKSKSLVRLVLNTNSRSPPPAYSSAALLDSSNGSQSATYQYPPQSTARIHGHAATESSTVVGEGSYGTPYAYGTPHAYGTPYAEPWIEKPPSDSPTFNVPLPPTNDTQQPSSSRRRRPSRWRILLIKSPRFARFTYSAILILVLVLWGIINYVFTTRERRHQTVWRFDQCPFANLLTPLIRNIPQPISKKKHLCCRSFRTQMETTP